MTKLVLSDSMYNAGRKVGGGMLKTCAIATAVAGSLLASNVARAEERGGLYADRMRTYYRYSVSGFENGDIPSAYDDTYKPGECARITAGEKKAGAKPGDLIPGEFKDHPKVKSGGIPFSEAGAICTAYEAKLKIATGLQSIKKSAAYMKDKKGPPTAEQAKGFNAGAGESTATLGKECLAAVDGLAKEGKPTFRIEGVEVKLDELKKTCQATIDYGTAFEGFIAAEKKAKRDEIAKRYTALGVAGAKLDLFVEYDDVYWRNTKCEKVDDPQVLAKAKVLIHWLENSDGTQTIRRYTFNGNKFSKTEKSYLTEALAQRNCR